MRDFFDNGKNKILIGMLLGIFVFIIIIIFIVNIFNGQSLSYSDMENKLIDASKKYYNEHSNLLPINDGDEIEITSKTLSENEYMKDLNKYQKNKNVTCSGIVKVTKNGNYYNYSPYLECGDLYTTTYLYEKLLDNVVNKDDGLYKTTQYTESKKNETVYVYRGEFVKNYILLDERLWRIVKIHNNHDIMIIQAEFDYKKDKTAIWDNRYNTDTDSNNGINDYYKSVIRRKIVNYYSSDDISDNLKEKIVLSPICIGSRNKTDSINDGSLECSEVLDNEYISLLPVYDFINASLDVNCNKIIDKSCSNYNYLTKYNNSYWLLTVNKNKSDEGYQAHSTISNSTLSYSNNIRLVTNLTKNLVYQSGTGTYDDPYIIK
ncbi:MAG: hypothetical protein PUD59_00125 [bacterium]|nr:hypothetical protein [bacterium]